MFYLYPARFIEIPEIRVGKYREFGNLRKSEYRKYNQGENRFKFHYRDWKLIVHYTEAF